MAINVLTLLPKIKKLQCEVMFPLYGNSDHYAYHEHSELLRLTGYAVQEHKEFIEELASSKFIKFAFKIVVMLGGAKSLTMKDFDNFVDYVQAGGIDAMMNMLKAPDMEAAFLVEMGVLPEDVARRAPDMLAISNTLHTEFVTKWIEDNEDPSAPVSGTARTNLILTTEFIRTLTNLAEEYRRDNLS